MLHQHPSSQQSLKHPTKLKTAATRQMWPICVTERSGTRKRRQKAMPKTIITKPIDAKNGPKQIPLAQHWNE